VPPDDPPAMAAALVRVLGDARLAAALANAGRAEVQAYGWPRVREQWSAVYGRLRRAPAPRPRAA
jgi:glycosyltransferase involved in cell wall biosynthesis